MSAIVCDPEILSGACFNGTRVPGPEMIAASPGLKPAPDSDPLLEEIHAMKAAVSERAGNDVAELCRQLQRDQEKSGHPIIKLKLPPDFSSSPGRGQ